MLASTLLSLLSLALSARASPFPLEKVARNQVDVRALRQRLQDKPTRVVSFACEARLAELTAGSAS